MEKEKLISYYEKMYKIRMFEENLFRLFGENKLSGTTHTCIGQEAVAVCAMEYLSEEDIVFSNHRCHGHFIAYSGDAELLLAEIMGKERGMCKGRGGSQHLCHGRFFSNGVQGGIVPNAVGMAWAEKIRGSNNITVVFVGDGTLGQGVVYESFNIASLFDIPVLFVIENNGYAMTTKIESAVAGSILGRLDAFGIKNSECDDRDVDRLDEMFHYAVEYVRKERKPFCQIVNTYRLAAHSKGDDYREKAEVEKYALTDPLKKMGEMLTTQCVREIQKSVEEELKRIIDNCETYVNCKIEENIFNETIENPYESSAMLNHVEGKMIQQINAGLMQVLKNDSSALILGEDVCDPYGGAFKATKGISTKYPEQIINMPISEAAMIGVGVGLAANGCKPIVEMMFGDFITLGFDQILNHATKYNWMYAEQVAVPLIIRVPSGGGRGYGATHSQTLEKYFIGIPNLRILALSPIWNCNRFLLRIVENIKEPTLLIENKRMYGEKMKIESAGMIGHFKIKQNELLYPSALLSLDDTCKADATIITYGEMTTLAMEVAETLFYKEEMLINVITVTQVAPIDIKGICSLMGNSEYIFTLEEGTIRAGWGAEVIASLRENEIRSKMQRIGAKNCVISCNKMQEAMILPSCESVVKEIKGVMNGKRN